MGVTITEFADAWGGLPSADLGRLRLDLAAAGVCAWEMPGLLAYGVHSVLLAQDFAAPVVRLPGRQAVVLFGAADAVPTKDQQAVITRGDVVRWDTGRWLLPDPNTVDWYSLPHQGMPLGSVAAVVLGIDRSLPIGVRRRAAR